MKKVFFFFLALALCFSLFACNAPTPPSSNDESNESDRNDAGGDLQTEVTAPMKIMSYNVQTGTEESVASRAEQVLGNILDFAPDVLGTQELNAYWIAEMQTRGFLDVYTMVGEPRDKADAHVASNEYSAIFYKTDVFNLIDSGTYWLSETPTEISRLDSCDYNRIMTYAVLERKSDGYKFLHVNTHLEWAHEEVNTNLLQTEILLDLTDDVLYKNGKMPVIFTGDFNETVDTPGYDAMLDWGVSDTRYDAKISTEDCTFLNGYWGTDANGNLVYTGGLLIDFCFASDFDFTVERFEVGTDLEGSDHFPIMIDLTPLPKKE